MTNLTLLPYPQILNQTDAVVTLTDNNLIVLDVAQPAEYLFIAQQAQQALGFYTKYEWQIVGGTAVPADQIGLTITIDTAVAQPQGYHLQINHGGIQITGVDAAGAFYGVQTLTQILQQYGQSLPLLSIEDWPDLRDRGLMLDVTRDKVPTMDTLFKLVDMLASWKINQLQLYTEYTFAYHKHPAPSMGASPITAEDILALDAYCRDRFIDLVPNQNCFGHMHRWFEYEQYLPLAEAPDGFDTPWGRSDGPFSLNPTDPRSLELVDDMFAELLPNFSSGMFNVNCDETFDVGQGKNKALCEQVGKGRVYVDYLLEVYKRVQDYGRTMLYWGDIVGHHPDLLSELPKNAIALEWGYEATHPFDEKGAMFADAHIPFYLCPGTSSWTTIGGRTDNALGNIRNAAENAMKHGALGLLNTDWGDAGHIQQWPVSFLGYAYAAGASWAINANVDMDVISVLNTHVFFDRAEIMGKILYDLGNIYQKPGLILPNSSLLFWAYIMPLDLRDQGDNDALFQALLSGKMVDLPHKLQATIKEIDAIIAPLTQAKMDRSDADVIKQEVELTAAMLKYGARRLLAIIGDDSVNREEASAELAQIISRYQSVWQLRNRPGGLPDSVARLTGQKTPYAGRRAEDMYNVFQYFV